MDGAEFHRLRSLGVLSAFAAVRTGLGVDHPLAPAAVASLVAAAGAVSAADLRPMPVKMPEGIARSDEMPNITAGLLRRGYAEADVQKILGLNVLRLFEVGKARTSHDGPWSWIRVSRVANSAIFCRQPPQGGPAEDRGAQGATRS